MFAIYEYKEIMNKAHVRDILEDICTLITYVPSDANLSNDAKALELWNKFAKTGVANTARNTVIQWHPDVIDPATHLKTADYAPKIYCSVDPNWKNASATSTGGSDYLVTTVGVNELYTTAPKTTTYRALLTAGAGTFEKFMDLQVDEPKTKPSNFKTWTVATKIIMNGAARVADNPTMSSIVPSEFLIATNATTRPEIYWNGGYLYISATENQLFIASLSNDRKNKRWTPGTGVVDFWPYEIDATDNLSDTDSYMSNGKYPTWLYMATEGLDNLYLFKRYNVISRGDQMTLPRCQIKNPYATSIANGVSIGLPASTVNSNWNSALFCSRIEFHNNYDDDLAGDRGITKDNKFIPHYDLGGDITKMTPFLITKNGKCLDTMDLVLPTHDSRPMDRTSKEYLDMLPDDKAKYPIDMATLSSEEQDLYKNYYGLCMLWGSAQGSLAGPGLKYVVRMG